MKTILIGGTPSDAHTWNLVFLQLWLQERGYDVVNLGSPLPVPALVRAVAETRPDLVAISTVNGHGVLEGEEIGAALAGRSERGATPLFIGGLLVTRDEDRPEAAARLAAAGFDGVFFGERGIEEFERALETLGSPRPAST